MVILFAVNRVHVLIIIVISEWKIIILIEMEEVIKHIESLHLKIMNINVLYVDLI